MRLVGLASITSSTFCTQGGLVSDVVVDAAAPEVAVAGEAEAEPTEPAVATAIAARATTVELAARGQFLSRERIWWAPSMGTSG
jgi:hypothetical protein